MAKTFNYQQVVVFKEFINLSSKITDFLRLTFEKDNNFLRIGNFWVQNSVTKQYICYVSPCRF